MNCPVCHGELDEHDVCDINSKHHTFYMIYPAKSGKHDHYLELNHEHVTWHIRSYADQTITKTIVISKSKVRSIVYEDNVLREPSESFILLKRIINNQAFL